MLNKYATCEDVTKLKWILVVPERINFTIAKLIFEGLLKENIPNLEIRIKNSNRSLRTLNKATLE